MSYYFEIKQNNSISIQDLFDVFHNKVSLILNIHYVDGFKNIPNSRNKLKLVVIEPTSVFYYRWLYIISLAVTYNLVVVVARAAFTSMQSEHITVWIIIDCISDAAYIADTAIQFRTG